MPKLIASNFFFLIVLFIVFFSPLCHTMASLHTHRAEIPNFIFGKNRLEFFNLHREWNSLCCYAASDIIFVQLRHYTERRSSIELAAQVVVVVEVGWESLFSQISSQALKPSHQFSQQQDVDPSWRVEITSINKT